MATVTASELQKNFGKYQALAQREPVKVTSHGRESVVLLRADEFDRLRNIEDEASEKLMDEGIAIHRRTLELLAEK